MEKRLRRNFLTGEWEEVDFESDSGVSRYRIGPKAEKRVGSHWHKGHYSWSCGVHPADAKRLTKAARQAGIHDVEYCEKTGRMISYSRNGRAAEMARRGWWDGDGGDLETRYASILGK